MPIPSDAHYTDRSRHNVRLSDGTVVSRSAAERIYAQNQGFRSNYERRLAYRNMKESNRYLSDRQDARGRGVSRQEFDTARARLQADHDRNGSWRDIDRSPGGPLAEYLTTIGRRSAGAQYDVGESPSVT